MDEQTLAAYQQGAGTYAEEWTNQTAPTDLYMLLNQYFQPGLTADIGCGAGRDTAWLAENGFQVVGFDASAALLMEASSRYPQLSFRLASLPKLEALEEGNFANILCETVIMHLPVDQIAAAVQRLLSRLMPGGILYLSWRVTREADKRDDNGRLYSAFPADLVLQALAGARILFDQETTSLSSGKTVHRLVARKKPVIR